MRSSISASNVTRATWLVLAGCLSVALGMEMVARVGFDRFSKMQRRTVAEAQLAETIGSDAESQTGRRHLLVLGNSLLDEDVRFDDVREALGGDWDARRFVVEQTFYLDWYYGLKRLFRAGARPDAVVVMLSTLQWIRDDIRGEYSAHYLMDPVDVPAVARDLRFNLTQETSFFVASVSQFWAARAEMRNFVLGHLMPDLGRLMDFSSIADPRRLIDKEVENLSRDRLKRMKELTEAHGAQLIVVLPAVLDRQDGADGFLRSASAVGVPALRPVVSGALDASLYRDAGFHLNPQGAAAFTERLIPALRQQLDRIPDSASSSLEAGRRPTLPHID
jgi:hypothetical protein